MGFIAEISAAGSDNQWRQALRRELDRVRKDFALYPPAGANPHDTFESAALTVREVAAHCLPLGIALVMHLYPLCALQCAPLPAMSIAGFKRRLLINAITDRKLVVANGGSERANGAHESMSVALDGDGLRVTGTFEYVSLASVADVVLFSATLADGRTAFCAAGMRGDSVRIGEPKFTGSMQFSDTRSITFVDHRVARGQYLVATDAPGARCIFDYQRCWFHLLLCEAYLSRIAQLRRSWQLPASVEQQMALNEVACLREYALRLLDDCRPRGSVDRLSRVTATMKLRVSALAQAGSRTLTDLAAKRGADAASLRSDASELCYMKLQPTSDARILQALL